MLNKLSPKIHKVTFLILICLIFSLWNQTAAQAQDDTLERVFILLAGSDQSQLTQVQRFIEAGGGRVTHTFPYQAAIAKIPAGISQQLSALPGVAVVQTQQPIELSVMDVYGPNARHYAGVWNNLIAPQPVGTDIMAAEQHLEPNSAFQAPDRPPANKLGTASAASITPGYYQTSEYMAGSVAVGIVLVESNGSVDPSTENWTSDEKQQVFDEIVAGLNWWAELEPRANLSFVYDNHFSNPLPTGVEPITRPYYHQQYWISDAMSALGYSASSYFTRVRDYNNDLRAAYRTDWAFTIFVVDSSADRDNRFSDGFFAYAYLGGPFMVMTSGNNGYGPGNMDAIAAHEMGHIFYALDQYYSAYQSCTLRSGYLGIENQNSQYGDCASNVTSIMRGQTYPYIADAIDPYAAGQVGWRDSDDDDILDPLDTNLPINIDSISQDGNTATFSGMAEIIPYPSPHHTSVTINTLTGVQYRIDAGDWQPATATDGAFDGTYENYYATTTTTPFSSGLRILEVAALDSAGNMSNIRATETITIPDPIDGGLNTQFLSSDIGIAGQTSFVSGVTYHLEGVNVTKVEYRIDGGPWQAVVAQDGAFDSDYEPFTLALGSLEVGTYLIEAFATADGQTEVNIASREIEIRDNTSTVFLPIVIR